MAWPWRLRCSIRRLLEPSSALPTHQHGRRGTTFPASRLPDANHHYVGQSLGLFKDVKENLSGDDVREGLVVVISVKLSQPQFEGQTKASSTRHRRTVQAFVNERLGAFLEQNPTVARKIINKAIDAARAREAAARPAT